MLQPPIMIQRCLLTVIIVFACASKCNRVHGDQLIPLKVLGLFPYRRSPWNGEYLIPAARLARKEINRNESILPGYHLELMEANSGCARDQGVREFVRNAFDGSTHQPVAILGPGCSSSTIPVASIAGRHDIRLPQVSYGATSPFLSLTSSFPYFYRTAPSDGSTSEAIISLIKRFNWKRYGVHNAGVGTPNQVLFEDAISTLRAGMEKHIADSREVYFGVSTNRDARSGFEEQSGFIRNLHSSGVRVGMMYGVSGVVGEMMCYLYQHKLTYPHVVWILTNNGGNWYNTATADCTVEQIRQATHGIIHLDYLLMTANEDDVIDVTNKNTFKDFHQSYVDESKNYATEIEDNYNPSLLNNWAPVAYDSMWTLGLALHNAEEKLSNINSSLADFTLKNRNISETIVEELSKIRFSGASGKISFNKAHTRHLAISISQVQNGALQRIGLYYPSSNDSSILGELALNDRSFLWSSDNPPLDAFPTELLLPPRWVGILLLIFLIVGFAWNTFSTLFNLRYQHFYSIKATSPPINYIIFAGNNLLLLSGVLQVISTFTEYNMVVFSTLCQTTHWLFNLGLLLVLNVTLLKSWRIHKMFYSFKRNPGKLITDNVFIAASIGWILVHTTYHILFTILNKGNIAREEFLPTDNQIRQKVVYCLLPKYVGLFYVPHAVMAVILCWLAFSIRRVYRKHFNDAEHKHFDNAKYIATFFYATIPIVTLCLTLSSFFSPENDVYNLATVSLILDCTAVCCIVFMCQLTLFLPSMLPVFKSFCAHEITPNWYMLYFKSDYLD